MKGLELSEKFYFEYGEPMLKEHFPELCGLIAAGVAGSGSECFGYDDEISQDHDFDFGFCIFLPDEEIVSRKEEFALERAYAKLPKSFLGYERPQMSPVGGNRRGVIRMSEFFTAKTGTPDGMLSTRDWFYLSEQSLAEATNGKVFFDGLGAFSEARVRLSYLPEDVRLKKLAGNLLIMGQSGQYNYPRCVARGDSAAAQLAVIEFVKSTLNVIFLMNKRYIPYYKWTFRAMRDLPLLSSLYLPLEYLISSANGQDETPKKQEIIEDICLNIILELKAQGISKADGIDVERHAYSVNNGIEDGDIRNLHILFAV